MKKVKHIKFRIELEGEGIVNYDSNDQKWIYKDTNLNSKMGTYHDNVNYAKKHFYKNGDNLDYKICISSDCLRHDIFKMDAMFQSPNVVHQDALLYSFISNPANILRGYMFADKKLTQKKKSIITITDAEQICNSISNIETFSRSGFKNQDSDITDNSFYKKETIGKIKYSSKGQIDLMQLQFVSVDPIFDRFSFNPDSFELYKSFLKTRMNFNSDLGYYLIKDSSIEIPEYGFKFSNDNVNFLTKEFFKRLLKLDILRKGSYAKISKLEYKLVYDVIEDTFDSENNWVEIKHESDIDSINFESEEYYVEEEFSKAKELRENIVKEYDSKKLENAEIKKEKANTKKSK